MALPELSAEMRRQVGTGAARALRRAGMIPAVLHQGTQKALLQVPTREVKQQALNKPQSLVNVQIKTSDQVYSVTARVQEVQRHPFRDFLYHLDFVAIAPSSAPFPPAP